MPFLSDAVTDKLEKLLVFLGDKIDIYAREGCFGGGGFTLRRF
jgi:hypothetical protein